MTNAKHTPGPWAWFGNDESNPVYLATTHSGRRFVIDFTRWGRRINAADARLIAAAPDLLEALSALVLNIDAGGATLGAMKDARAALAKAEGGGLRAER